METTISDLALDLGVFALDNELTDCIWEEQYSLSA